MYPATNNEPLRIFLIGDPLNFLSLFPQSNTRDASGSGVGMGQGITVGGGQTPLEEKLNLKIDGKDLPPGSQPNSRTFQDLLSSGQELKAKPNQEGLATDSLGTVEGAGLENNDIQEAMSDLIMKTSDLEEESIESALQGGELASSLDLESGKRVQDNQDDTAATPLNNPAQNIEVGAILPKVDMENPASNLPKIALGQHADKKPNDPVGTLSLNTQSQSLEQQIRMAGFGVAKLLRENPAIKLLTGKLKQLDPKKIPEIVTSNTFIQEAMGQKDLQGFMAKKALVRDFLADIGIDLSSVREELAVLEGGASEAKSVSDILKEFGVDPSRVEVELKLLKDNLSTGGLNNYMVRAAALAVTSRETSTDQSGSSPLNRKETRPQEVAKQIKQEAISERKVAQLPDHINLEDTANPLTTVQANESMALGKEGKIPPEEVSNPYEKIYSEGQIVPSPDSTRSPNEVFQKSIRQGQTLDTLSMESLEGTLQLEKQQALGDDVIVAEANSLDLKKFAEKQDQSIGVERINFGSPEESFRELKNQRVGQSIDVQQAVKIDSSESINLGTPKDAGLKKAFRLDSALDVMRLDSISSNARQEFSSDTKADAKVSLIQDIKTNSVSDPGDSEQSGESNGDSSFNEMFGGDTESRNIASIDQQGSQFKLESHPTKHEGLKNQAVRTLNERALSLMEQGGGSIRVDLSSAELGEVDMVLRISDDKLDLKILTGSEAAKDLLVSKMTQLRDNLANQQVDLKQVEVGVSHSNHSFSQNFGDNAQNMREQYSSSSEANNILQPYQFNLSRKANQLTTMNRYFYDSSSQIAVRV